MDVCPLITVAGNVKLFTEPRCIASIIDMFNINDDGSLTRSPSSDTKLNLLMVNVNIAILEK